MGLNYKEIGRDFRTDPRRASRALREALQSKQLRADEFSIRKLAEATVPDGREWVETMDPNHGTHDFVESMDAVNTSHFSNITGQITYSAIMENYENDEFKFTALIPTVKTPFSGERIPGVTMLGDGTEVVNEGSAYPTLGVAEDYIDTPPTVKRGGIVPITKEAIFFDRTHLVLSNCAMIGESLGLNKEKRAIDCVIDENTTAHRHKWRGVLPTGGTYNDSTGTHTWDNLSASTGLVDWNNIDAVELLLSSMLDPNTGEPIAVMADTLIVTPQLMYTARRILNATQVLLQVGGYPTTGNVGNTSSPSPIGGGPYSMPYTILSSRLLAARMANGTAEPLTTWYLGNPKKAFVYMENWPITVSQAERNSSLEFTNDIVFQHKASERGAYFVKQPRYMAKATA